MSSEHTRRSSETGTNPRCCPKLFTQRCERCGRDIAETKGKPCEAVPMEHRWELVPGEQE